MEVCLYLARDLLQCCRRLEGGTLLLELGFKPHLGGSLRSLHLASRQGPMGESTRLASSFSPSPASPLRGLRQVGSW